MLCGSMLSSECAMCYIFMKVQHQENMFQLRNGLMYSLLILIQTKKFTPSHNVCNYSSFCMDYLISFHVFLKYLFICKYTIRSIVCEASCHSVTRSLGHSVTWSLCHSVSTMLTDWLTNWLTYNIRTYRSASQTNNNVGVDMIIHISIVFVFHSLIQLKDKKKS